MGWTQWPQDQEGLRQLPGVGLPLRGTSEGRSIPLPAAQSPSPRVTSSQELARDTRPRDNKYNCYDGTLPREAGTPSTPRPHLSPLAC